MLTADLVRTRRRGDELFVVPLHDDERAQAGLWAASFLGLAQAHVGLARQDLLDAFRALEVPASGRKLADGLAKLVWDRCTYEEDALSDPAALREVVFLRAAEVRRGLADGAAFVAEAVLAEIAAERSVTIDALARGLFADLPGAHVLRAFNTTTPQTLVAEYELAQWQAVLLRAVRVRASVRGADPVAYRCLFNKLKFLQLLYTITPAAGGGYDLVIDGPFSLFSAVTKYGLKLALALPALMSCPTWSLDADVVWGEQRRPLRFRLRKHPARPAPEREPSPPSDLAAALLERLARLETPWQVRPAERILTLPGLGVCVPDLEFVHADTGRSVLVELLGYWNRDAVWKRVELARTGLGVPIVFAVSKHLRVSEANLPEDSSAALYVFATTPNPRALLARIDKVAGAYE